MAGAKGTAPLAEVDAAPLAELDVAPLDAPELPESPTGGQRVGSSPSFTQ